MVTYHSFFPLGSDARGVRASETGHLSDTLWFMTVAGQQRCDGRAGHGRCVGIGRGRSFHDSACHVQLPERHEKIEEHVADVVDEVERVFLLRHLRVDNGE